MLLRKILKIFFLFYCRKDSSLAYMWFFFIKVIQCVTWLIFALGPPGFSWFDLLLLNVHDYLYSFMFSFFQWHYFRCFSFK